MIPVCWKCASGILENDPTFEGAKIFKGCKENPAIDSWERAMALCPLLPKNQQQIRDEVDRNGK